MSASSEIAIHVANLSKEFRLYSRPSDMVIEILRGKPRYKPFWALQDVSFNVHRGQVMGIIGRNGAGKSTLLKILSGIMNKTSGEVEVRGRISSILELGTGFSGEYTGRENIYLGGLMVGLTREEVREKEEWIIEFSELEDFIDQPFKTYSTGMQARLTFATAVCIDPDILIVDEALSVGDVRFQRKSFSKIEEFRKFGRTILLVSHDINTISTFCDYAILLEKGRIFEQGEPQHISIVYYKMLFSNVQEDQPKRIEEPKEGDQVGLVLEVALDVSKISKDKGKAWKYDLSESQIKGDSIQYTNLSKYIFFENGNQLRPAHASHEQIRKYGNGAYSHWLDHLYFSSSDNSDPRKNGRLYILRLDTTTFEEKLGQGNSIHESMKIAALKKLGLEKPAIQNTTRVHRLGTKQAEILDFGIYDKNTNRVERLISGEKYTLFFKAVFYENLENAEAGFLIRSLKGIDLFGTSTLTNHLSIENPRKGEVIKVYLDVIMNLTNNTYFITYALGAKANDGTDHQYDLLYDAFEFEVQMKNDIFTTSMVNLDAKLRVERL